jgi:hypothetical protein
MGIPVSVTASGMLRMAGSVGLVALRISEYPLMPFADKEENHNGTVTEASSG